MVGRERWSGPDLPAAVAVHQLLDSAAGSRPVAMAVRDDDGAWTYEELADNSWHAARWLRGRGIGDGDRLLVRLPNVKEFVALMYGASRLGAILVPISPTMGSLSLRGVLTSADPALVVTRSEDVDQVERLCDPGGRTAVCDVKSLREELARARTSPDADAGMPAEDLSRLAFLLYTSGSTAEPKGVRCPHGPVLFAVEAIARRLGYTGDDRVLCRIPLSFDYGLYQTLLCAAAGAEIQLTTGTDAALLHRIEQWRATVVPLVPTLAAGLALLAGRRRSSNHVRLFTNTGAALQAPQRTALRRAFPDASIALMYGMTECKRISVLEPGCDLVQPESVGRALEGTSVTVVDDRGQELGPGQIGQFVVRGPHVMDGYWRAPEASAERFRVGPDGIVALYTGDYGYLDADGYLYLEGRRDDIFKRRDVRCSTTEIEAAALRVPGVHLAAVLQPSGSRDLTLVVVADCPPEDVLSALRGWLEPPKVPAHCEAIDEMPVTVNGKVDRAVLEKWLGGIRA
jgi:acyl-CoA synthetase (AMP-forming)/AMP-acid ligase II